MQAVSEWQKEMTRIIGEKVKELRGTTTVLSLQKRTEELGFRVSRSAISELETGKRNSISVAELLVLAAALKVPPGLLLFPYYPDGFVEYLPGQAERAYVANEWLIGQAQALESGGLVPIPSPLVGLSEKREKLQSVFLREASTSPEHVSELHAEMLKQKAELETQLLKLTEYLSTISENESSGEG